VEVVHGINLESCDGDLVILNGPSRRGKRTILRMVAGHEDLPSGGLAIDGMVVNERDKEDRDIAPLFHDYALHPA